MTQVWLPAQRLAPGAGEQSPGKVAMVITLAGLAAAMLSIQSRAGREVTLLTRRAQLPRA